MDVMLSEFGRYVRDAERTRLFEIAIAEQVQPGDVVVDLGTGFGLLAMLAARRGAARVYAIEQEAHYLELARDIARDNGLADRIVWIAGNSAQVELPERADVVISETLGQFALEEHTVEYLFDARRRFLRPGGRLLPQALSLFLTPVELPRLRAHLGSEYSGAWADVAGFDLRRLRQAVMENSVLPYLAHAFGEGDRELGPAVEVARYALGESPSSRFLSQVRCTVDRPGTLDGFLGTFTVKLSPSAELSTHPGAPPTHWNQVVFPVVPPRLVAPGASVDVALGFHAGRQWSYVPTRA